MKRILALGILTLVASVRAMDITTDTEKKVTRRPSLPALKLSLAPRPTTSTSSTSPRPLKNAKFLELLSKFIDKRQAILVKLQEDKQNPPAELIKISQDSDQPIPPFSDDSPYRIIEKAYIIQPIQTNPDNQTPYCTNPGNQTMGVVRKVVPNKEYDEKYNRLLGIKESDRNNSGDYSRTKNMGTFSDFKTEISEQKEILTLQQEDFLCYIFGRFNDNYQSSTAEEIKAGKFALEIGKIKRGFDAAKKLLEDTNKCKQRLSPVLDPDESSSSSFAMNSAETKPRAASTLRFIKKTIIHTRERSNSDVH